jgi:general secretion pathway protein A
MKRIGQRILMITMVGVMGTMGSYAEAGTTPFQAEETARLIAALLSTGRVVIDRNQTLIDDPNKGDKGFTPEVFERQVINEFRVRTGVDLTKPTLPHLPSGTTNLLHALLEASKEVVAAAQPVINQKGVGYKNFIPATFGSQVAGRFSARSGVQLKQTTLEPRNPKNAPDAYEEAVLRRLMIQPSQSVTISGMEAGNKTLRVLTPIYYTRDCLTCHGGPAGEMDISGYRKEGAEEGDLAGAISVSIPLDAVK